MPSCLANLKRLTQSRAQNCAHNRIGAHTCAHNRLRRSALMLTAARASARRKLVQLLVERALSLPVYRHTPPLGPAIMSFFRVLPKLLPSQNPPTILITISTPVTICVRISLA